MLIEKQVGGDHYETGGTQHWDLFGPEYLIGCATKYVSRWRKKNGVQDLEKALHYAQKLRKICKSFENRTTGDREMLRAWCKNAGLDFVETTIVFKLMRFKDAFDVDVAIAGIEHLIENAPRVITAGPKLMVDVGHNDSRPPWLPKIETCFACEKPIVDEISWIERDSEGRNRYYHDECRPSAQFGKKSPASMSGAELTAELAHWTSEQEKSTQWGAAVGARGEIIDEIRAEQARRVPERKASAPGANGVRFSTGDMCTYLSPDGKMMTVKVLDVLQDGEADIDLGGGCGATVKWHALTKVENSVMEVFKSAPRTPEDDGQHASLAPWCVEPGYFVGNKISDDIAARFWNQRAPNLYVLEPHVESHGIPRVLRSCYTLRGDGGWTLDIGRCPLDARDMFPDLYREKNMKEWEELPEWQRVLYTWNGEANKYELSAMTRAWHVEAA